MKRKWTFRACSSRDGWYIRAESMKPSELDVPFLLPRDNTPGERAKWPMLTKVQAVAIVALLNESRP